MLFFGGLLYDDDPSHSDGQYLDENDETKVSFSKVLRVCLLIGAIIFCLCSLCSSPDDNTPLTDKYQTTVIVGVKNYLRNTLKDPDSYQDIEWSQIGRITRENYTFAISIERKIVLSAMWLKIKSFILTSKGMLLVARIIIRKAKGLEEQILDQRHNFEIFLMKHFQHIMSLNALGV